MSLGTMEQRTEGMKKQANELIDQTYQRGYKAGYSKAENDYHSNTEKDRQSSYELGLNMAWEAARKLVSMGYKECNEVLGDGVLTVETTDEIFVRCTASEAIEKLRAYEEKKQEEEEICVGDEIRVGEEGRNAFSAVVHLVGDRGDCIVYQCVSANGLHYTCTSNDAIRKTGRHFDVITEVLKKMQEADKDERRCAFSD